MAEKQMDEDIVFAEMSNLMEQWKQKQITCEEFVAANQALIHKKYNNPTEDDISSLQSTNPKYVPSSSYTTGFCCRVEKQNE
ncbi:unnamed protein product [Rotaria socialis]|uniref:Uncharacterized protein n=1 Tax=Rotaria socialis TaxID=392032 RepID=A0A820CB70_9BILA|nr:unnamed protein product [Rotaria socialis]CAF4431867.1 unnamed protein product [Rotaria socialis]CAF4436802.1 unnamed protein product [Rotaria socialis]CAF4493288.1 unnamed protein product [Rotaria socialis]CAF4724191.1 unnamed protein product [Rotaria socialis]